MSIFSNFFGQKTIDTKAKDPSNVRGKFVREERLPIDERFTINFKDNGGKFLYCEDMQEIYANFELVIKENNWQNEQVHLIDDNLKKLFVDFILSTSKIVSESCYFFTTCEYLISDNGSILVSSNQIAEKKPNELPEHIIVFAKTSQLVDTISEGLKGIKTNKKQSIPTNITTLKNFKINDDNDFLTYGTISKNLYLLLLEDL